MQGSAFEIASGVANSPHHCVAIAINTDPPTGGCPMCVTQTQAIWLREWGPIGAYNNCSLGIAYNRAKWAVHRCGTRHHRSRPELAPASDPEPAKDTRWRKSAADRAPARNSHGGRIANGTMRTRSAVLATVEIRD